MPQPDLSYDKPLPDPAWDYATLWDFLHKAQRELENLIQYTAQIKEGKPETDKAIGIQLEAIAESVRLSLALLKKS
jgi:hypothetical protein